MALNIVINTIIDFELSPRSTSFYICLYELALDVVQHRTTQMNFINMYVQIVIEIVGHICDTNLSFHCGL